MFITDLIEKPIASFRFLNAARRGGVPNVERIGVMHAHTTGISEELDAIIATADLQGLEHWETANGQPPRLMGEVIPRLLTEQVLPALNISPARTGVLLCGDLYTVPGATKRGGTGDVTSVWHAFGSEFHWVAGVAGNHDTFGNNQDTDPSFPRHMHFLDGDTVDLDGINVAGIGGTIGSPTRNRRRTETDFCELLELMLAEKRADIVIMHDGPDGPALGQKGSPAIRQVLGKHRNKQSQLVIRGHAHWEEPLISLTNKTQVLNVDSRIVIMQS